MGATELTLAAGIAAASLFFAAYLFWRYVWFFRNPRRAPPADAGIVSPADGTVVYVRSVEPAGACRRAPPEAADGAAPDGDRLGQEPRQIDGRAIAHEGAGARW